MNKASKSAPKHSVEVKNFGPILDAHIELRPMTVFVGPSNTGKSYLATLLYALHKFFESSTRHGHSRFRLAESKDMVGSLSVERILEELSLDVSKVLKDHKQPRNSELVLSENIVCAFAEFINDLSARLDYDVERYFGREIEGLKNVFSKNSPRIVIRRTSSNSANTESKVTVDYEFGASTLGIPTPENLSFSKEESRNLIQDVMSLKDERDEHEELMLSNPRSRILLAILRKVFQQLMGNPSPRAFYIPADRTSILFAQSEVVADALQQMATAGIEHDFNTTLLTGVQADFLSTVIRYLIPRGGTYVRRRFEGTRKSRKHAQSIEEDLLRGSITVERDQFVDFPRFQYRPAGWRDPLPLKNASSMVGEIGSIVTYLKYIVRPKDLIIIEEPESHLHPEMQVKLTRILAAMVKDGYRVVITTHSEWLIEELSNIVARSGLKQSKNSADSDMVALDPRMIGTWLFTPQIENNMQIGSTVKEIGYDEYGIYSAGFDEVAQTLHNDWVDITSRLDDQK